MGCLFSGTGDEARTRFHPPRKGLAALCGDPRRPRIGKTRSARFRWRQRVRGKAVSSPGAGGTQKRRRGPDSLPPTPQRAFGPLQGPRAPSDWKKRAPRVFSVEAASSGKGGVFPRRWRDTKRATRPGLASAHPAKALRPFAGTPDDLGLEKTRRARFEVEAAGSETGGVLPRRWRDTEKATRVGLASAHPTKCLRPFAGPPGALGLEKTRSARFEVEAASSRERRRPPLALAGHKTGDEARTRFRPPCKGPAALCRDPGRPRIGKKRAERVLRWRYRVRANNPSFRKKERQPFGCLSFFSGASDEARTRYLHLGKVALYQMSYARRTIVSITGRPRFVKTFFTFFLPFTKPGPQASFGRSPPSPHCPTRTR